MMSTVQKIEEMVMRLSDAERSEFRDWYLVFEADEWDRQIVVDSMSGKLDDLMNEAIADHKAGKTTEL